MVTKDSFELKIFANSSIFLNGFRVSFEKSEAKTKLFALNSFSSFLITKTGMLEKRTIFSVLEPTKISLNPDVP